MMSSFRNLIFSLMPKKMRFGRIYRLNQWGSEESVSGAGSTLSSTEKLRIYLPELLQRMEIQSFLDAPCGDFHWMKHILNEVPDISYTGVDIVQEIINKLNAQFQTEKINFLCKDLTKDNLPRADLVLNRDCLLHLSFSDTKKALVQIKKSNSSFLLTSTYPHIDQNYDIVTGRYRFINLQKAPYNFPSPIEVLEESANDKKYLGLWNVKDIPVH